MSPLMPDLFERRFQDLMELGRARLPSLAPEWTDHNAHDPGITLMELLAWVAEAQLYSLSRLRRDERLAFAALLGLAPEGTRPARGVLWRDRQDPGAPAATFERSIVIPGDAVVKMLGTDHPTFRPGGKILWVPGRITKLEARSAGGRATDLTAVNERGGPAFLPFGERAGRNDVLAMTFRCRGETGLFGPRRDVGKGARWAIGIRTAPPLGGAIASTAEPRPASRTPLTATLVADEKRVSLAIASDLTQGMLETGALLLDLDAVSGSPQELTIELQSAHGFPRPPRLLQIEPNVLPIEQGRSIVREVHVANGMPDWSFDLDVPGLSFAAGKDPVQVEVAESTGLRTWERRDRLSDRGPDDRAYELDAAAGRVTFGNGVNGVVPPAESQVLGSYAVSDGAEGNVARNRRWQVVGFEGAFGVNLDPVAGGTAPLGWIDQRREARHRLRDEHALVSADDVIAAAKALPMLEVARAWVLPPLDSSPRTGVVALVAMRSRPSDEEPEKVPETRRWLESIRRRLAGRMPLGTRLAVSAPRYVEFTIAAKLEAQAGLDPAVVGGEVVKALRRRLALVETAEGTPPRQPGVPVSRRDMIAWMSAVEGVRRVVEARFTGADGRDIGNDVAVPRGGLPRWHLAANSIQVNRPAPGSTP